MRAKYLVLVICVLLCISIAHAQEQVDITIKTIKNTISVGDTAVFNVTLTNNMRYDDTFKLTFSDDIDWTILTDPLKYKFSQFDLGVGESVNFLVKIRAAPSADKSYNQYLIGVKVIGESTETESNGQMIIGYGPQFLTPKEYAASVVANAEVPEKVDPRNEVDIKVYLRNKNPLNITDLEISVKSSLFEKTKIIPLGPNEEKTIVFSNNLNPLEQPKQDKVVIEITRHNVTPVSLERTYEIIPYSQLEEEISKEEGFLKTTTFVEYKNNGNYLKKETVAFKTTFIKSLFTKTIPNSKIYRNQGRFIVWDVELDANETVTLVIIENYLPVLLILSVIVLIYLIHLITKSPIVITKSAIVIAKQEGGIAGLKIVLTIKNIGTKTINNVWIVDSVPNIAVVDKDFEVGSLEPQRVVRHEKKGTLLKYQLGSLERNEERILRYKIRSRLAIIGSFVLPAAVSKFSANGGERIVYSNRLKFNV